MQDEGQLEHRVDRTGWPAGPWDSEPEDRWEGRHAGFPVLAVRNSTGNWCGYVGVPPGHPWHGRYDDLDVNVHGGITYGAPCQSNGGPICHVPAAGEPETVWWLGFDCAHWGDIVPTLRRYDRPGDDGDEVYRSLGYVQEQTRALADQAAAAAAK
jgi:hypothetical protein